ncbi:cation:proton antiporter domain-containing protein [Rhodoblastus sp.]|uniref:cation:proton antiporter domain-containing protein n=1 Tax=Rhodoblastus sp. TaxID=1962975 RepID=UPI003F96CEEE
MQLAGHFDLEPYKTPLLFLGVAGVVVPLFRRLRISPVLGFLLAGMAIGPYGFGRLNKMLSLDLPFIAGGESIAAVAAFGVVFLMFNIGLELSLERLHLLRRFVFGLGSLQVAVCGVALFAAARAFGLSQPTSVVLGAALALSSTAITVPVLAERRRLNTLSGRAIFSVLLFQDLIVAPILFVTAQFGGAAEAGTSLFWTFAPALIGVALIVGAGRLALRPLFQLVAAARSTELFMAACLLVVIGAAVTAAYAGLSMALGAFIAGLLLAETEFRRAVELAIDPFKGLLLGLFFVSVGAGLDPLEVIAHPTVTLGIAFGIIAIKTPLITALARLFGPKLRESRKIGLMLGPGGEFAFLIVTAAQSAGLVSTELGGQVMIGVTLSMALIPLIAIVATRPGKAEKLPAGPAPDELAPASRVIIVGYGRVGQIVGALMRVHNVDYICVDGDARIAAQARGRGEPVYWGDATRRDFLDRCGLAQARALVVTMHTPSAVDAVVRQAREARDDLTIVARARDAAHARALYKLGATDAVPETMEASLQLSEAALVDIGVPMGLVIASIHEQRDLYRKALVAEESEAPPARPFIGRRKKR